MQKDHHNIAMGKRSKSRHRHQKGKLDSDSLLTKNFSKECDVKENDENGGSDRCPAAKRQRLLADQDEASPAGASNKQSPKQSELHVSLVGDEADISSMTIPPPINTGQLGEDSNTSNEIIKELGKVWTYLRRQKNKKQNQQRDGMDKSVKFDEWAPTPIQQHAWSILLNDIPFVGIASTGSGKTFAYAIPILLLSVSAVSPCQDSCSSSILILAPTRELVHQVAKACNKIIKAMKKKKCNLTKQIRTVAIHGGVDRESQIQQLKRNKDGSLDDEELVVIGTPGRLLDILKEETLAFRWIVLDEADQLTKEGDLGPQVDQILNIVRSKDEKDAENHPCTLALVSATYPQKCHSRFGEWVGSKHILVKIDNFRERSQAKGSIGGTSKAPKLEETEATGSHDENSKTRDEEAVADDRPAASYSRIPSHLTQVIHVCAEHKKPKKLVNTLKTVKKELKQQYEEASNSNRAQTYLGIIFFNKIDKLKYVFKLLQKDNVKCVELHSQLPRHVRERNLERFSCGANPLMLSTDLAARGIHIPQVRFVIQYDFPGNLDQYVHRCGRAGRSGQPAKVYSFFTRNFQPMAADLIQLLEANEQWVDPNLRLLVNDSGSKKSGKPTTKKQITEKERKQHQAEHQQQHGNRPHNQRRKLGCCGLLVSAGGCTDPDAHT